MFIEPADFYQYSGSSITRGVITRILAGAGHPISSRALSSKTPDAPSLKFSYLDFTHFILANEHKTHASSIEYWFRVLDTDGDGVISMHELYPFWAEQNERMIAWRVGDPWSFEDFICVTIDLLKPVDECRISVGDMKRAGENAGYFLDMLIDIGKYEAALRRVDPMWREMDEVWAGVGEGRVKLEGWDKFGERAYDLLVADEGRERFEESDEEGLGES
jgi:serine/threonine-protein phosphatase 2A regulatory subunit B''